MSEPTLLRVWPPEGDAAPDAPYRVLIGGDVLPVEPLVPGPDGDWGALAAGLAPLLDRVDATVANLECPVTARTAARAKIGGSSFRTPPGALGLLTALRVRAVSLANNHVFDYGDDAVADTVALLHEAGIPAPGATARLDAPPEIALVRVGQAARVGVWTACFDLPETAGRRPVGLEPIRPARASAAAAALAEAGATVRIALLHLGLEKHDHPEPADADAARAVAAAGFDVVACCHGHRIQGFEVREGRAGSPPAFVFHGLGSLASGCMYGMPEREGLAVVAGLDAAGRLATVDAVPVFLAEDGRPLLPCPERAEAILARVRTLSAAISDGSFRDAFHAESGGGVLRSQVRDFARAFRRGGLAGVVVKLRQARWKHVVRAWNALIRAIGSR